MKKTNPLISSHVCLETIRPIRRSLRISRLQSLGPSGRNKCEIFSPRRSLRIKNRESSNSEPQSYQCQLSCCGFKFANALIWFKHRVMDHIMTEKLPPFICIFCKRIISDKELYVIHRYVLNLCQDPAIYSLHRPGMYDSSLNYPPSYLNYVGIRKHVR